jgi:tetratricopeptide (TPR) repeat protein
MLLAISRQSLCHTKLTNIPAAIERAESAFLLNPSDFVLRKELSTLLFSTGVSMYRAKNYATAKECLNRVIWLSPTRLDTYLQMGHIYLEEGNTNAAKSVIGEALKLKPDFMPAKKLLETIE